MIREDALQTLLGFEGTGAPVLSLYLNVDSSQRSKAECRLRARQLLEQDGGSRVARDIDRIEEFLRHEYDWQAKGLVIFSCAPKKLWHVVRLPTPVVDSATVSDQPYLRPLSEVLSNEERIGVALVDREVARYFSIYMGGIQELGGKHREMIRRHKQQGPSPKLQRAADESAHQNLKQAARDAAALFQEAGVTQALLAGQAEQIATVKENLPKAWQSKVIGEFAMDTDATPQQVLNRVDEIMARVDAARQAELVDSVASAARKKGPTGTLGLSDTLAALMDRKVMTLITAAGFAAKGFQCENCGYLSAAKLDACPACGNKMRRVDHLVDLAIRKAFENDAHVESIRAPKPAEHLTKLGGIGALLRY